MAEPDYFGSDVDTEFESDVESDFGSDVEHDFASDVTPNENLQTSQTETAYGEVLDRTRQNSGFRPLDFIRFGERVTVDTAPRFGLFGEAYFFTFTNQDQIQDADTVARAGFDHILDQAFSEASDSDLVGVAIDHPALDHELLVHFGKKEETTTEKVMETIGAVQQSKRDLNFDETMTVKITRITPPEGRGYRKLAKGRLEDFFKKHSGGHGSTFIEIKNNDWLCFARAVVVAKARYQYHVLGDQTVPFDAIQRGETKRNCMQRSEALHLMTKAGLLGLEKRSFGIQEFKKIQKVLQKDGFQLKVFSFDHFDALIFDDELPQLVPLYIYHHNNHYTPMSSPKILTGTEFYCDLCNRGYNRLETHKCPMRCPCCKSPGRCPTTEWILCQKCNRRFGSQECFNNHNQQIATFRTKKNKRSKVQGQSLCMKLKRCLECGRCVKCSELAPSKHHCGMNYCSVCKTHWKIGEIHECFMQPITQKPKQDDGENLLPSDECQNDPDDLDNLIREEEERQGETEASRQEHFQKSNNSGISRYLFWDFETVQSEQPLLKNEDSRNRQENRDECSNDKRISDGVAQRYVEKTITLNKKHYSLGPVYLHNPNYCIVRKACMVCKDFWLSPCKDSSCKGHSCQKCVREKPDCRVCGDHYKRFIGDSCKEEFCSYLFREEHRGITAIAHNAKGFDAQFLIQWLVANRRIPKIIPRGLSVLSLEAMGVRVIDSFAFLPQSLESLPKTFNEPELKKGYFPYLFNQPENWNYVGPFPDANQYCPSQMKEEARNKFYDWYNQNKMKTFDFQKELKEYTESDVDILLRCSLKFNDLFHLETGVYPLEVAVTIAQACNHVFRKNYLNPNTIGVVPTGGYRGRERQSLAALEWLRWMGHKTKSRIQHARNGREKTIGRYKADGFIENDGVVLEFNGCVYHGCRRCYKNRDAKVPNSNLTYEEAYQKTIEKAEFIRSQGFELIEIWECEWNDESTITLRFPTS